jgi:hypothetical protein
MLVDAAGALQQGIGTVNHCCCFGECAMTIWGPGHPLQRLFANLTPDGVFRAAWFCYELPVVDGPLVYNGFLSWYAFFFYFYFISFVRHWYPVSPTT